MKDLSLFFNDTDDFPCILVVGAGNVGTALIKSIVDNVEHSHCKIYVTDSDKERARQLSEYRLSSITPIRWRSSADTPDDVDVIVVAVDHDAETKLLDRLVESSKPFVSLCDDADVYDEYLEREEEFKEKNIVGVLGAGLVPGMSDVITAYISEKFSTVHDIVVDRIGFVSTASLASIKSARRDAPLSIRDGVLTDSRRDAGSVLSWFVTPYGLVECQSVATGVRSLKEAYPQSHNITVRYGEPRLPTFSERVRNIFLRVPLRTTNAAIKVEVHGVKDGVCDTEVLCLYGDAMAIVVATTVMSIRNITSINPEEIDSAFVPATHLVDESEHIALLMQSCAELFSFEGVET